MADPEATEPEDWEEEEDGVWEAPLISNPKVRLAREIRHVVSHLARLD